jgi:hypothetical protein
LFCPCQVPDNAARQFRNRLSTLFAAAFNNSITNITSTSLVAYFNNIALHAVAMSLSAADNALLQFVANQAGTGSGGIGSGSRIETINHPLPRSLNTRTNAAANSVSVVGDSSTGHLLL